MAVSFNKTGIINASGDTIGKNLLMGTHLNSYSTTANTASDRNQGKLSVGSGGNGTFSVTAEQNLPIGIYSYNVLNNTSGNRDFQQGGIPYVANQKYTGSWWAKGTGTCLYRSWNRTKGSQVFQKTYTLTDQWTFYSYTFTATQAQEDDDCTFHLGVTGNASIYMCGMKLEQGEIATPWIPNESDWGYTGNTFAFIETGNQMSVYPNHIQTTEFIEY